MNTIEKLQELAQTAWEVEATKFISGQQAQIEALQARHVRGQQYCEKCGGPCTACDPPSKQSEATLGPAQRTICAAYDHGVEAGRAHFIRDDLPALLEAQRERLAQMFNAEHADAVADRIRKAKP